jgi:cytochrome P450
MFWRDPPEHTRLRTLVRGAFRPSSINRLIPRIEVVAAELVDCVRDRDEFDVLHDVAHGLPSKIITEMIGMPLEMMEQYNAWSRALVGVQEPGTSEETMRYYDRMAEECLAYLDWLIAEKRREPGEDIISHLLECSDREDLDVTLDEVLGLVMILNAGGQETTENAIANGMLALMRHPEQYRALRDDPSLVSAAAGEAFRYDTPARLLNRYTKRTTEIGGVQVEQGATVFGLPGSAHHDETVFQAPASFDLHRADAVKAMWFGVGPHYCIGARLAWAETEAMFRALISAFPTGFTPTTEDLTWRDSLMIRGLDRLPVCLA